MTGSDTSTGAAHRSAPQGGQERPIDQWLRRSLCATYDRVLTENLPEAWLSLIEHKRPHGRGA
jgi:hypothetical protein